MEESIRKFRLRWITWGLILSAAASLVYMACYDTIQYAGNQRQHSFVESESNLDWLLQSSLLLYRDLRQKSEGQAVSYEELYMGIKEGYEWVLENEEGISGESAEASDENLPGGMDGETAWRIHEAKNMLQGYFQKLENDFDYINQVYDYWMQDLDTGAVVTNQAQEPEVNGKYFFLEILFDEYGNVTVGPHMKGEDEASMRKTVTALTREGFLEKGQHLGGGLSEEEYAQVMNTYFSLRGPRSCRLIYCIDMEAWNQLQRDGMFANMGGEVVWISGASKYNAYYNGSTYIISYAREGFGNMLVALLLAVMLSAFLLPVCGRKRTVETDSWCRVPIEVLAVLGIPMGSAAATACMETVIAVRKSEEAIIAGNRADKDLALFCVYASTFLILLAFFALYWFVGMNLRQLRILGIKGYIKRHSLIYRFFPFMKSKGIALYESIVHFDVTKNAHRMILRITVINAIVLFCICSVWMAGFPIAVVYSIGLYLLLRKYVSDLQKKYGILLEATNKIAEGNLNVTIPEDLGVFEPFKPQIMLIQEGFGRAVEEEVRSQRMKAELITNVSHDLKTPLTAIITYIDLLKDENITQEQRREYLDTLERKSLRLKALIEDLFEVSKANSQNMTLNRQDVDVMHLVRQAAFEMEDKLAAAQLELRMNLPEEKIILSLDSQKTYRIYENLFGNIAKYALPGTRVYVDGCRTADGAVSIVLKNISAQEITVNAQELTERFVRGDASRNTEGSGLGLAIAQSFARLQGGELSVEVDGDLFKVSTLWKDGGA